MQYILNCVSYGLNMKQSGGESGIRTRERSHAAGFQDRFFQPLRHLSVVTDNEYYSKTDVLCQHFFIKNLILFRRGKFTINR